MYVMKKRNERERWLLGMLKEYTKEVKLLNRDIEKVKKELLQFAPFKKGDRVMYSDRWASDVSFKHHGRVVRVHYGNDVFGEEGSKWTIQIEPLKKDGTKHGNKKSHEWLGENKVKLYENEPAGSSTKRIKTQVG
jgi:hypothetical protein